MSISKQSGIPNDVKNFLDASQHTLATLIRQKNQDLLKVPMHIVRMKIKFPEGEHIVRTVIPDTYINLSYVEEIDDKISKNISYTTADGKGFPIAHVFRSGGSLCLGSIFVPSLIDKFDIMLPLETLFLYNDRNVAHGNPSISVKDSSKKEIEKILNSALTTKINLDNDWVKNDTLWRIGYYALDELPKDQALSLMSDIFSRIFKSDSK